MPLTSTIGVIKHVGLWVTSTNHDKVYVCPAKESKEKDTKHTSSLGDVVVYCVHGTGDRNNACSFIAENLQSKLPPEVKAIRLVAFKRRGQFRDIPDFAQELYEKIQENGDSDKNIIFVGHSRGALIASFLAPNLPNALATINICGPFKGSPWAYYPLTVSKSVDQMSSKSPFLDALAVQMKSSNHPFYYFSASDDAIVPAKRAFLEDHAHNHIKLKGEGHASILQSKELVGHMQTIINDVIATKKSKPMISEKCHL